MGKSLVIKGADFSENGIATLITWAGNYTSAVLAGESGRVVAHDNLIAMISTEVTRLDLVGKTIKYVKLNAASAGTLKVYTTDTSSGTGSNEQSFQVAQGINIIELTSPIYISSNAVGVGVKGNGVVRYWASSASYPVRGWQYAVNGPVRVPVDFGW
jgi:hypothetical protein